MNFLIEASFEKLWGDRTITIPFNRDVTFLIGRNGSGKTTVVNVIAAALKGDFETLRRSPVETVVVRLGDVSTGAETIVRASKQTGALSKGDVYISVIRPGSNTPIFYQPEEQKASLDDDLFTISYGGPTGRVSDDLSQIMNLVWLSVHRTELGEPTTAKRTWANLYSQSVGEESSVDSKLENLSNRLVRYFSQLTAQYQNEALSFHRAIFRALLTSTSVPALSLPNDPNAVESSKQALMDIIAELHFAYPDVMISDVNEHFDGLREAGRVLEKGANNPEDAKRVWPAMERLLLHGRIARLVEEWNVTQRKRAEIYATRDRFLNVLNGLLWRKEISINDRNELVAITQRQKSLGLKQFSSGEKQLLILFGEALLKSHQACTYIADEPELSLHVSWQESLVRNLLQINPAAQIIFATHSPDIVSDLQSRVINMEEKVVAA
jgi:predicted ATPase